MYFICQKLDNLDYHLCPIWRFSQDQETTNYCCCSEGEKVRRWQEIKIRQHRLLAEADQTTPAHIDQIIKSGFSMSDIKGTRILAYSSSVVLTDYIIIDGKYQARQAV